MQQYFEVGQIVNTFGIKGFIKIKPFTDEVSRFEELKEIYVEQKNKELKEVKIEKISYQKELVLLKLKGIDDLTQAEKLKGLYLKISRKNAKKLPKGTYFIADLIGMNVYSDEGKLLGKLDDVYSTGANDVYVVKNENGIQVLLPATQEVIKQIDLDNEKIIVHMLEGLV